MRVAILLLAGLVATAAWADGVYRYRDESGRLVFTDQPRPGAEAVTLPPLSTYEAPAAPPPAALEAGEPEAEAAYQRFALAQPEHGETVHSNPGRVPVAVTLEPELRVDAGHRIGVVLDGQRWPRTYARPRFVLDGVHRGSHTLQAVVLDAQGQTLMHSAPIEFHVWQASTRFPSRQPADS